MLMTYSSSLQDWLLLSKISSWNLRHWSPIHLQPLTCKVNKIDYLVTMASESMWDILGSKRT